MHFAGFQNFELKHTHRLSLIHIIYLKEKRKFPPPPKKKISPHENNSYFQYSPSFFEKGSIRQQAQMAFLNESF